MKKLLMLCFILTLAVFCANALDPKKPKDTTKEELSAELISSIMNTDSSKVKELLGKGADVNYKNIAGTKVCSEDLGNGDVMCDYYLSSLDYAYLNLAPKSFIKNQEDELEKTKKTFKIFQKKYNKLKTYKSLSYEESELLDSEASKFQNKIIEKEQLVQVWKDKNKETFKIIKLLKNKGAKTADESEGYYKRQYDNIEKPGIMHIILHNLLISFICFLGVTICFLW